MKNALIVIMLCICVYSNADVISLPDYEIEAVDTAVNYFAWTGGIDSGVVYVVTSQIISNYAGSVDTDNWHGVELEGTGNTDQTFGKSFNSEQWGWDIGGGRHGSFQAVELDENNTEAALYVIKADLDTGDMTVWFNPDLTALEKNQSGLSASRTGDFITSLDVINFRCGRNSNTYTWLDSKLYTSGDSPFAESGIVDKSEDIVNLPEFSQLSQGWQDPYGIHDLTRLAENWLGIPVQAVFFVSPNGSDSNPGTYEKPFSTINKARNTINQVNDNMSGNIIVFLRGGTYNITDTISFDHGDSGSNGYRVIYQAYNNEIPVVSGGVDLTSGWSLHGNGIYKKTGVNGEFRQLYANGKTAIRARTPNKGAGYYSMIGWDNDTEEIKINSSDISNWGKFDKVEIVHLINWTKAFLRLSSFRTSGEFAYVDIQDKEDEVYWTRAYPIKGGWGNSHNYYYENAYEFLDNEGEWYLDTAAETLYYKPRSGETMGSTKIMAPGSAETLVKVEGSLDDPVRNLTFYGITFEHSNWLKPYNEGALDLQASQMTWKVDPTGANNMWVYRPPAGILVKCAQNVTFERNIIRNMGAVGIDLEYGTEGCEIIGNLITQTAANGVSIGKFTDNVDDEIHAWDEAYNPADAREISTDDIVSNNYIYKASEYYSGCAIAAGYPKNLHIEHNYIDDCQYTGISVGFGWTDKDNAMSDNFIAYNRVCNVVNVLQDGGGIYTLSKQPGTEIRENYISSVGGHGPAIYLDEGTGGTLDKPFIVADNVLGGGRVHQNVPSGNIRLSNNVSLDSSIDSNAGLEAEYRDLLPTPVFGAGKIEAEKCKLLGYASAFYDTAASSDFAVENFDRPGSALEFEVVSQCTLKVISYCSQLSGHISFYINGDHYKDITFTSNGAWNGSYATITEDIDIPAGATCRLQNDSDDSGLNIDFFVLSSNIYEAEDADLSGGAAKASNHPDYFGTGFVAGYTSSGASTLFTVYVSEAGNYDTSLRYANEVYPDLNGSNLQVYINDSYALTTNLPETVGWGKWETVTEVLALAHGINTIRYSNDGDWRVGVVDLECIKFSH